MEEETQEHLLLEQVEVGQQIYVLVCCLQIALWWRLEAVVVELLAAMEEMVVKVEVMAGQVEDTERPQVRLALLDVFRQTVVRQELVEWVVMVVRLVVVEEVEVCTAVEVLIAVGEVDPAQFRQAPPECHMWVLITTMASF